MLGARFASAPDDRGHASPAASQRHKRRVVILATGGTIAGTAESSTTTGYTSGAVPVDMLIAAVPQLPH